jgi:hypothetical protein
MQLLDRGVDVAVLESDELRKIFTAHPQNDPASVPALICRSTESSSSRERTPKEGFSRRTQIATKPMRPFLRHWPLRRQEHQADSSLLLPISGEVEAIEVHHFGPRRHEVGHEFLLRVGGAIDFGKGAQLGV